VLQEYKPEGGGCEYERESKRERVDGVRRKKTLEKDAAPQDEKIDIHQKAAGERNCEGCS